LIAEPRLNISHDDATLHLGWDAPLPLSVIVKNSIHQTASRKSKQHGRR